MKDARKNRKTGDNRPDHCRSGGRSAPLETRPPRRQPHGDPETLVAVDNPDDVDLYRHDGPPPGFRRNRDKAGEEEGGGPEPAERT